MIFPKGFDEIKPFLARREIFLIGDIYDIETQEQIISMAILYLNSVNSEPIKLFIDSCGGSGDVAQLVSDNVRNSVAPIHGIVIGVAYSAGFTILQACHWRLAYPNAKLMFHGGSLTIPVDSVMNAEFNSPATIELKKSQVSRLKKRISSFRKEMKKIARRSGQPLKKIKKWWQVERHFTAKEAKKFGFIDEIIGKSI